jgi:hypothetical protein
VLKTAARRSIKQRIARVKGMGYATRRMTRPPTPPRTYITRHCRFPRKLDIALRQAAKEERRRFTELLILIVEDWLAARARAAIARELGPELPPPRPRRHGRKPL